MLLNLLCDTIKISNIYESNQKCYLKKVLIYNMARFTVVTRFSMISFGI